MTITDTTPQALSGGEATATVARVDLAAALAFASQSRPAGS